LNTVDVDDPFFAVDLSHLALTTLVFTTNNPNFIIFPDREGTALQLGVKSKKNSPIMDSYVVLAAKLLGKTGGHDLAADGRGGGEVGLAGLPS
jgi:hypothetical protein